MEADGGDIVLLLVLPALIFLAGAVALMFFLSRNVVRTGVAEPEPVTEEPPPRPWWGNPLVWLAISAVMLLLGLFVVPQFLPGVFIFLPFIWIGGGRRRRQR